MSQPHPHGVAPGDARVPTVLRSRRVERRADLLLVVGVLALGALLGVVWFAVQAPAQRRSDTGEASAAPVATFLVLALGAGLLTLLMLWWGRQMITVHRFGCALIAAAVAAALAVGLGVTLGAPRPDTWAVFLVWPLVVALGTAVGSIVLSFRHSAD